MLLEITLLIGLFHHKKKPAPTPPTVAKHTDKWVSQRKYLDRAANGIVAYENDDRYARLERPELDAFENQYMKCYDEKDSDPDQFVTDMDQLDLLGQVLDSVDADLHHERAI
jgi:hypothetical protein